MSRNDSMLNLVRCSGGVRGGNEKGDMDQRVLAKTFYLFIYFLEDDEGG